MFAGRWFSSLELTASNTAAVLVSVVCGGMDVCGVGWCVHGAFTRAAQMFRTREDEKAACHDMFIWEQLFIYLAHPKTPVRTFGSLVRR